MSWPTHAALVEGNGRSIVVVGAGGHAKVLIDCLIGSGWNVVGCTDADSHRRTCAGVPVIGTDDILGRLRGDGVAHAFCALGSNAVRERVAEGLLELGFELPAVAGAGAHISSSVRIGRGVAIMSGATINIDCAIGDLAIINTNSSVDHDGVIGRAAHVAPGAALAGCVQVGDRTFIGTGSSVIPERRIGADSIIGAGSVVVRDIGERVVAFGNPARVMRRIE